MSSGFSLNFERTALAAGEDARTPAWRAIRSLNTPFEHSFSGVILKSNGMKPVLPLFIFIDACGWEIIKNESFLTSLAPSRKKLESVFGYSSACVPSILSGRWPAEHRNWSYFVYDPQR